MITDELNVQGLLIAAEAGKPGLLKLVLPKTELELERELQDSPWLFDVLAREEIEDVIRHTTVSEETRRICEAELAAAAKNGYRII